MPTTKELVSFDVKNLKGLSFNPVRRTKDSRMGSLIKSMKTIGLIQPITITKDGQIIDGHRRVAVAKKLKWFKIDAIILTGIDEKIAYQDVNCTSAKMNGNDYLGIWLKDPTAVTPLKQKRMSAIESIIGRSLMTELQVNGFSTHPYQLSRELATMCKCYTEANIVKILEWILKYKMVNIVRKALKGEKDPKTVMSAVHKDKPIEQRLAVAK